MNKLIGFILMLILGLESFLNQHGQIHPGIHLFIQWFFGPFMLLPVLAMVILEAEGKWKKFEVVFCAIIGYLFGLYIFAL